MIPELYRNMPPLLQQLSAYVLVGAAATGLDLSIFSVFTLWLGYNYLLVAGAGFIIATVFNYYLCIRFIYVSGSRFNRRAELASIFLVGASGLAFHQLLLYAMVDSFELPLLLAKLLAIIAVFSWNFAARQYYVFAEPAPGEGS